MQDEKITLDEKRERFIELMGVRSKLLSESTRLFFLWMVFSLFIDRAFSLFILPKGLYHSLLWIALFPIIASHVNFWKTSQQLSEGIITLNTFRLRLLIIAWLNTLLQLFITIVVTAGLVLYKLGHLVRVKT